MTPDQINALADRTEALDGPSFAIECEIGQMQAKRLGRPYVVPPPAYTASIDAAMSLVQEGHEWMVNWCDNSCAEVSAIPDGIPHRGHAATPALALTAAALRAIAKEMSHD